MTTIATALSKTIASYRNRVFIKRVNPDGSYEAEWKEITEFLISVGDFEESWGDNIFIGEYDTSEFEIELDNTSRRFSNERTSESLFFGFKSRFGTRVRRDVNILIDGVETNITRFYGVALSEPTTDNLGVTTFTFSELTAVFKRYPARFRNPYDSDNLVEDITTPQQQQIPVMRNRNIGDAVGALLFLSNAGLSDPSNWLFGKFFESITQFFTFPTELPETNLTVTTQANTDPLPSQRFATNRMHIYFGNLDSDETVFEALARLLTLTFTYMTVNENGILEFKIKELDGTATHQLNGNNTRGLTVNISEIKEEDMNDNIYNRVIIQHHDGETIVESNFRLDDQSTGAETGVQDVEVSLPYQAEAGTQELAESLLSHVSRRRRKFIIKTDFNPTIRIGDVVEITVEGQAYGETIIGEAIIGEAIIGHRTGAIILHNQRAIVSSNKINEYNFKQELEVITL